MIKLLIITALLVSSITVFPQEELESQFDLALNYYEEEKYFDSITEFKRLLYFDSQRRYAFTSNFYIAKSYKKGGKFSDAVRYFNEAVILAGTSSEIYDCKIEIIKTNILRRTTERALKLIDELLADSIYLNKSNELYYWKGWAYIFSDKWLEASNEFEKIPDNQELALFTRNIDDSLYNETLAKVLSYIIPGAGQIYSGQYSSGLLSFGWNLLWGFLTINSFVEERIFDGFVIGNFLWLRFYNGNIHNAGKFVTEKNQKISNRALDYLQFEYSGWKP